METKQIIIKIPKELHKKFKRLSFEKEVTMKDMLIEDIKKRVNDFEKESG